MNRILHFIAFSSLVSASVLQHPLQKGSDQAIINNKPTISSEDIQSLISSTNLMQRAKELYKIAESSFDEYNHPTRVIGSPGHAGTIDYIYSTIAELGDYYDISNQTFPAVMGNVLEYKLILGNHVPESAAAMSLTPPTTHKEPVFGPLVLVANEGCHESDYPRNMTGSVALIQRGTCAFGDKSANAGKAGAIAAVVYNNEQGSLSGTLGEPSKDHIATFGISSKDAQPYLKDLLAGELVNCSAYIDSIVTRTPTTNIIAQTKGGDRDNCVMLGGHSDSVADGPGINDDGTGTMTLLEVATQLAKFHVNNCVRFAWWAGEEEGLLGSDYYVSQLSESENMKIRLFMDYDMLASPNYAYQVYDARDNVNPVGSGELRVLYTEYYEKHGLNYTYIPFDGRSDYDAFIKNGIPGGGIATGAEGIKTKAEVAMFGGTAGQWYDPCYHQLCDDISNLAVDAWVVNTKLVAHSVAVYAESFEGFPERSSVQASAEQAPSLYHGPKLVM